MQEVLEPFHDRDRLAGERCRLRGSLNGGEVEQRFLVDELTSARGRRRGHEPQDDAGDRRVDTRLVEREPQAGSHDDEQGHRANPENPEGHKADDDGGGDAERL